VTSSAATPGGSAPGSFETRLNTSFVGAAFVAADGSPGPTAWAKTFVYAAPYLEATFSNGSLLVNGSGFPPGANLGVYALADPSFTSLGSQDIRALQGTPAEDGTFFVMLPIHNYVGNVAVVADGGGVQSNWVITLVS
jgi:hypothetical protein